MLREFGDGAFSAAVVCGFGGAAARRAERVSQRAWRRRVPLHARATSCALVRAEAAVCGSGGASALRACRLHCVGVSAARAMAVDAIFGCIRLLRTATMHEFEAALHQWRWSFTPQPPRVAFWQSWLLDYPAMSADLTKRGRDGGSSWLVRWRSIISKRGRLHLLKEATVRIARFPSAKTRTKRLHKH